MKVSMEELERLTEEYGGAWGINHTKRLLRIISIIDEGLQYNHDAIAISAYIHDWGAYKQWAVQGVDHAVRSKQVAEEFLNDRECEEGIKKLVLECIENHHAATKENSIEARLLSDADALDFLGIVGVLRDFSKKPSDLRKAFEISQNRRNTLPKRLLLDKSHELADKRVKLMDELYMEFKEETFGIF